MENVNNLSAFFRSVIRASGFADMRPRLRQVLLGEDEEVTEEYRHLHHHEQSDDHNHSIVQGTEQPHEISGPQGSSGLKQQQELDEHSPLIEHLDAAQDDSSTGANLVPLRSKLVDTSQQRVQELAQQREESREQSKDDRPEPLYITKVHRDDGTEAEVIVGQSTLPQTIYNSSNTLIGIGILSLPLAFRYTGWVIGFVELLASALVTKYTAGLLAKCIDVDSSLANFADIAYVAFGEIGRGTTSALITLELLVGCVGLVILFADTLGSLIQGPDDVHWKVFCGCVLVPINFLPMRLLGFTSFLGVFCNTAIVVVALVAGFMKRESPGSLRDVAVTSVLPQHWKALPLSFGLVMALWTGHSVFPNIYRDMRHPPKYGNGLKYIFGFVTAVDIMIAVVGYLLYGDGLLDEITTNMLKTQGYPKAVKVLVLVLISVVPLTKFPLFAAPIVSTLEVFFPIDPRAALLKPNRFNRSRALTWLLKAAFRALVTLVSVLLAIELPSFELISALMGGLFGFLICIILPVCFHLKMFSGQISRRQWLVDWTFILVSAILAVTGTVWEFLPRGWIGL